ncbi:MAG: hypothetical protein HC853_17640 [Anaerolineae bacterium]|nr:hypothetical protein [Anaerolineae bacterium]
MQHQVPSVSFSWRLPGNTRTTVTFSAETKGYDESQDRVIIVLGELQTPLDVGLDSETQALIQNLKGKWVRIPSEARLGPTLPLKYETLTGRIRYFYDADPRTKTSAGSRRL